MKGNFDTNTSSGSSSDSDDGDSNNNIISNNAPPSLQPPSLHRQPSFSQSNSSSDDEDYNDYDNDNSSSGCSSSDEERCPDINLPPTKLAKLGTDASDEFDVFVLDASKKIRTYSEIKDLLNDLERHITDNVNIPKLKAEYENGNENANVADMLSPSERRTCTELVPTLVAALANRGNFSAKNAEAVASFLSFVEELISYFVGDSSVGFVFNTLKHALDLRLWLSEAGCSDANTLTGLKLGVLCRQDFLERLLARVRNPNKPMSLLDIAFLVSYLVAAAPFVSNQVFFSLVSEPLLKQVFMLRKEAIQQATKEDLKCVLDDLVALLECTQDKSVASAACASVLYFVDVLIDMPVFGHKVLGIWELAALSLKNESVPEWVQKKKALQRILGSTSAHIEFVRASRDIIKAAAAKNKLDAETIEFILKFIADDAPQDTKEAMSTNIAYAVDVMSKDTLPDFDRAFARLFAANPSSAYVRAVVTCIVRQSVVIGAKSTCVEMLNEMALDDNDGKKEAKGFTSASEVLAVSVLKGAYSNLQESSLALAKLKEFTEHIKRHVSCWQSYVIAGAIVCSKTAPKVDFCDVSELIESMLSDQEHFKKVFARPHAGAIRDAGPGNFLVQRTLVTYRFRVETCFAEFVKVFSSAGVKMSTDQMCRLWDVYVQSPVDTKEPEMFMKALNFSNGSFSKVEEGTFETLLSKKVPELEFHTLGNSESLFLAYLVKCVNVHKKSFVYENNKWLIPDYTKFVGLDVMLKLALEATDESAASTAIQSLREPTNYCPDFRLGELCKYSAHVVTEAFKLLADTDTGKSEVRVARLLNLIHFLLRDVYPDGVVSQSIAEKALTSVAVPENYAVLYSVLASGAALETKRLCFMVLTNLPYDRQLKDNIKTLLGCDSNESASWDEVFGLEKGALFVKYALLIIENIQPTDEALLRSGAAAYLVSDKVFQIPCWEKWCSSRLLDMPAALAKTFMEHVSAIVHLFETRTNDDDDDAAAAAATTTTTATAVVRETYIKKMLRLMYLCMSVVTEATEDLSRSCVENCVHVLKNLLCCASSEGAMEVEGTEPENSIEFLFVDRDAAGTWMRKALVEYPFVGTKPDLKDFVVNVLLKTKSSDETKKWILSFLMGLVEDPNMTTFDPFVVLSRLLNSEFGKRVVPRARLEGLFGKIKKLLDEFSSSLVSNKAMVRIDYLLFLAHCVCKALYDGASVRTGGSSSATETDGGNIIEETEEEEDDDDDDDDDEKRWTGYEKELFNEVWYNCLFGTLQRIVPKCLTPVSRGNGFMCACDLVKLWSLCGISPVNVPALIDEQLLSCDLISPCHAKLKSAYLECSGLVNLGATCYMNSVLQQLYMIPAFREGVLGLNLTGHKDEYLWELQKLFTQMHSGISKSVSTAGLVKKLKIGGHPIDTSVQMDAMELFEAVVSKTSYDVRALQQNNSQADFVDDIFGYKSCKMIIPSGCPHTRESLTSSTSISLSIKGKPTLQMSLADLVKGERLVGDNQFMCDACAQKRDTLMREYFYTTPNVLVVQCKRFEFNHFVDMSLKVNDYFEAPMSFSMWPYTKAGLEAANEERGNDGDDDSYTYDLVGFVVHSGVACGGHYYSYIKNRNGGSDDGSWIKFDDTDLSPSSFENMPQYLFGGSGDTNAYLLFYQKRSWKAPQQPQQALAASPTYKAFYDDVLNRNRLLMKADVLLSSSFVVFIENMFLRSGAPLSNAINYDMILHIFLTIVHKIDEVPQAKDYCSDAYHYVQVSSMALWQHALENACKVHPGFLDCFLFSSPDNAVSFLWKYLAETPQQNAHFAFASVIATKISTLAGLAQTNAIASCLSLIDNVCKRDKNPAGLFVLYKLLARSGPATAQALLNGHVLGLLASVGLFSESSSDWASCKTKVGLYIDSFVDAIVSVLAAVRDWTLSVPEEDFDKLLEKSFHKDVTSISYDAEVVLLKALLAVVSGENNTMLFGNCLGAVLCMTYDGSLLGILLESVLPYFEPHADELDPLRASIFMQVFVEEEGERIKKKNKDPYKNLLEAVSSRLVDPERFPAVADWLFANFGKWLYLFLVRPTLPSIRADGLSLLFRAVGCNEPTSEPLTEPQVLRLRATLDYILHNFADLTKAMDHMHIKYLALSKVFMVCTRPEVHATNIVDRASVHTLIEFVGIVNKSEYMYEETDWDADARFVIMRFLVTLAQSPDGKDTIPEYIADSPHLSDFFRLVGPRTTLDASNPSSADEPISDMCTLASFVLACRPQALAAFFPNSNAFTWLLRAILFSELRVSAPGARAAVAGLVRDMLASTGDLGVATGRKLGAVFAALCSTPLDCVVSAINNTVLSLGSDLPDASLAAFCGGGAFDFMRAVLCCHCTDEGIVDFICSFLLVISTRKGSPQALLGRPECKDATYALALDVALSASRDVDIWTALAPMLPDPELFVAALWKRLIRDLPQGRDAYSGVADAFIAEEAKKEGPTPKCASFVQLYNAVFFGAAQDSADASLLFISQHVTPQMAQIFVVEVFNSPATRIGPAPTEGVVVAMQKVVANIPEPEKLALNFVGCLTSKPCRECQWTEDEKRLWLRRARMLLTLFGDFIEGYTAQDLLSFMISIDCEKSDIHNEISLLKNMCVDEKNNLKK